MKLLEYRDGGLREIEIIHPQFYPLSVHFLAEQQRWSGGEIVSVIHDRD